MQEIWKPIAGFEGIYDISNLGRVKSLARLRRAKGNAFAPVRERIRVPAIQREGYVCAFLCREGKSAKFYIHRLVATAFLDNPENLPQVNHIDGNKQNNRIDNLEWTTASQNCRHAIDESLYQSARGETAGNVKLTEENVREIRRLAVIGLMHKEIAELFGVGRKNITKIVNRQRWKHVA